MFALSSHGGATIRRMALTRAPGTCATPGCTGVPIYRGRCKEHARWPPRHPARTMDGHETKRRRARLEREQRGRCARCGRRIPTGSGELNHVDGDPSNDRPANLELVHARCNPRGPATHKR
jgi:hypothetical protein